MAQLIIRPLVRSDFRALRDLIIRLWDYESLGGRRFAKKVAALNLYWCLTSQELALIAEADGRPLGLIIAGSRRFSRSPLWIRKGQMRSWQEVESSSIGRNTAAIFRSVQRVYDWLLAEHGPFDAQITLFAVAEELQGRGAGRQLFAAAQEYLKNAGCQSFFLFTDSACSCGIYNHFGMLRLAAVPKRLNFRAGEAALEIYLYAGRL